MLTEKGLTRTMATETTKSYLSKLKEERLATELKDRLIERSRSDKEVTEFEINISSANCASCSLEEFTSFLVGEDECIAAVWLSLHVYCLGFYPLDSEECLALCLIKHGETRRSLYFYHEASSGQSFRESLEEIDFMFRFQDEYFEEIQCWSYGSNLCPLPSESLRNLVHSGSLRQLHVFLELQFTAEQCAALAQSCCGLEFAHCGFIDGGTAFTTEFSQRGAANAVALHFVESFPFNAEGMTEFLASRQYRDVEVLRLENTALSEEVCLALAFSDVQHLNLHGVQVEFADDGLAMAQAISQGHGPRELSLEFTRNVFGEEWSTFWTHIVGNTHLERLELKGIPYFGPVMNGSMRLKHLVISHRQFSEELFSAALQLAENHPCLLSLELSNLYSVNPAQENETHVERRRRLAFSKTIRTASVTRLLDANQRLLSIVFDSDLYDSRLWEKTIVPRLQCNHYRKKFADLHSSRFRAALLAHSFCLVSNKPAVTWMLICQSQDLFRSR